MAVEKLNPESDDSVLKQIARHIASPPQNSRIFTITPAVAAELLQLYNEGNRPKKPKNIGNYANDMMAQDWAVTGDNLKFSDAGRLRDGQHRLMACAQSGVPFTTHVVFGVPDEYFDRIDQGKPKGGSDLLAIAGVTNGLVIAGAIRWAKMIDDDTVKKRDSLEPKEILRLYNERYSGLQEFVGQADRIYRQTGHPKSLVTALLYHFDRANSDRAQNFCDAWQSGQWEGKFKSIGIMQRAIATLHTASLGRVHDTVRAALIVKAWNLFVSGRTGRKDEISWSLADPFPKIERA
jgi:hypothetical protein